MLSTIYLTTVICDGCGCATLHDEHVRCGSFHYEELRALFENEGWGEINGKHYCPACQEDMPTEFIHPNLRDDNEEIAHIELPIFVSHESAKALKKAGFPQRNVEFHCVDQDGDKVEFPACPSLDLALKWLREKQCQYINVWYNESCESNGKWETTVYDSGNACYVDEDESEGYSYEDAVNNCIKKVCLRLAAEPESHV